MSRNRNVRFVVPNNVTGSPPNWYSGLYYLQLPARKLRPETTARETPSSFPARRFPLSPGNFLRTIALMPMRLFWFACIATIACFVTATSAQSEGGLNGDRVPHRRLSWTDFRVDDKAPGLSAQTQTFLSYKYTAKAIASVLGDQHTASIANIEFSGGFDRSRSWRRSSVQVDNGLLLEHEQGHLDLNELKLRQLRAMELDEMPIGQGKTAKLALEDLDAKLRGVYKWHLDDLEKTQKRYDRETRYGTYRLVQAEWTERLRKALEMTQSAS
jgi:hypothetical protein